MLGEKMKLIRNYNGYSQRQIAEILKIERSTYASYETGRNRPDIFAVQRFAKIFNVSVDYILSLDDINIYRLRAIKRPIMQSVTKKKASFHSFHPMKKF